MVKLSETDGGVQAAFWIGWALCFVLLVLLIIGIAIAANGVYHFAFTWKVYDSIPYQLDPLDSRGSISTIPPTEYSQDVADYLYDNMARYMRYFAKKTDEFVLRPNTRIAKLIYTEGGSQLSCVVLEETSLGVSIVLFKGTTTTYELLDVDLAYTQKTWTVPNSAGAKKAQLVVPDWLKAQDIPEGMLVHRGFQDFYGKMRTELRQTLSSLGHSTVYVCGHSLGAAVATVCTFDLTNSGYEASKVYMVTAGCPRVGNLNFALTCASRGLQLYNLRNLADIIPTSPWAQTPSLSGELELFQYTHAGVGLQFYELGANQGYCHSIGAYQRNTSPSNQIQVWEY